MFKSVVASLIAGALAHTNSFLNERIVEEVNSNPASTWKASTYPDLAAKHDRPVSMRGNVGSLGPNRDHMEYKAIVLNEVGVGPPESYDLREVYPGLIHPPIDQGKCGSCWSVAVSLAFSDRLAIKSKGAITAAMSPQFLLDCDEGGLGCEGSSSINPIDPWQYIELQGIPTEKCWPYTSGTTGQRSDNCPYACVDNSNMRLYKSYSAYRVNPDVNAIKQEIMDSGSVEMDIALYEDFQTYKGGIYKHTTGQKIGGHAMRCVGWGVEGSEPYWIIANSYGPGWGENGYVRIAFGQVGVERTVVAGAPKA